MSKISLCQSRNKISFLLLKNPGSRWSSSDIERSFRNIKGGHSPAYFEFTFYSFFDETFLSFRYSTSIFHSFYSCKKVWIFLDLDQVSETLLKIIIKFLFKVFFNKFWLEKFRKFFFGENFHMRIFFGKRFLNKIDSIYNEGVIFIGILLGIFITWSNIDFQYE